MRIAQVDPALLNGRGAGTTPAAPTIALAYSTALGSMYHGLAEDFIREHGRSLRRRVQLVMTSPPFPLNHKKKYGNKSGPEYIEWLTDFAQPLAELLKDDGSLVIELGNAWEPGRPVMSTLALRAMIALMDASNLNLCQQFVVHNPARLPSPAQWVNVTRTRVKDAYTHVWWLSRSDFPKADNRRILKPYSSRMQALLAKGSYNSGRRPSEHNIGATSFLTNNGGAIPSNVLTFSNTASSTAYHRYCRSYGLIPHPARMAPGLVDFFVRFLTEEGDLVLDPFAGSNTTGAEAERLRRKWVGVEPVDDYVRGSASRFAAPVFSEGWERT